VTGLMLHDRVIPATNGNWLMPWETHDTAAPLIQSVMEPLPEEASSASHGIVGQKLDLVELTRGLAAGDDDAFREFHRRYFDRLYRLLLLLCRGEEIEARDALQDTLCRVARHARRFDREDVFWCWLVALARSAVRDAGRKRHRYWKLLTDYARRWLPVQADPGPDHDRRLDMLLRACLDGLDPVDRALVEGKYLSGLSVGELSRQSGFTGRAVESRLFRLRRQLRKQMLLRLREDPS
jgi:RNA polymerase sigma factor (sigma-70 family)